MSGESGYVLPAVTVLIFVMVIGGLAFFMTASYENGHARHTDESTQAFMLADAGTERVRAALLSDRTWRTGWTDVSLAGGSYSVSVTDTTLSGLTGAFVRVTSVGEVDGVRRAIETIAEVPPLALTLAALAVSDFTARAVVTVEGQIHVNGTGTFGNHGQHLHGGDLSTGFEITPPPVYTDPSHLPGTTYYEVRGTKIGSTYQARIFDAAGNDITSSLGDSLTSVTSFNAGTGEYTFDFGNHGTLVDYFDQDSGVFRRAPGDVSVAVNFGEAPLSTPPGPNGVANLVLRGNGGTTLESTIINTRFEGVTADQRLDDSYWTGGLTETERVVLEPPNGISLIVEQLYASSHTVLGTESLPGLVYLTGGPNTAWSHFDLSGNLISMGDMFTGAHVDITFDPSYLATLPSYLMEEMLGGVSGSMRTLTWREIAVAQGN